MRIANLALSYYMVPAQWWGRLCYIYTSTPASELELPLVTCCENFSSFTIVRLLLLFLLKI